MNTPSHTLEDDINLLSARMSKIEKRLEDMTGTQDAAPTPLPVDKKTFSDYGRDVASSTEADEDDLDDEELANPMGDLTQQNLREVVAAFDELLRWKEFPNSTMSLEMREYIDRDNFRRLQEAIQPLERVVRSAE
jgi:hypothetical protein